MVRYEETVLKRLKKGKPPREIFLHFNNAFISIDITKDLTLFDIRRLKTSPDRTYFRLRKGAYRGIFFIDGDDVVVIAIDKREEVYKKWL